MSLDMIRFRCWSLPLRELDLLLSPPDDFSVDSALAISCRTTVSKLRRAAVMHPA